MRMATPLWRRFLAYFVTLLLIATGIVGAIAIHYESDVREQHLKNKVDALAAAQRLFRRQLYEVLGDTKVAARNPSLDRLITAPSRAEQEAVEHFFFAVADIYPRYDQIRLLDLSGKERVRVQRRADHIETATSDQLGDKSSRYYFKEGLKLEAGQVYVSPLDLNEEQGRIETPYVPTIRVVTPVSSPDGKIVGMLVLNYRANGILSGFREIMARVAGQNATLLNHDGQWLVSADGKDEWGWLLGHKGNNFAAAFPREWEVIQGERNGTVQTKDGYFLFSRVSPLQFDLAEIPDGVSADRRGVLPELVQNYHWHAVLHVTDNAWKVTALLHNYQALLGMGSLVLLLAAVAALGARLQTDKVLLAQQERDRARQFEDLYEQAPFGYCTVAPGLAVLNMNTTLLNWLGYSRESVVGHRVFCELVSSQSREPLRLFAQQVLQSKTPSEIDVHLLPTSGLAFRAHLSVRPLLTPDGHSDSLLIAVEDIDVRYQLSLKLERLATTDELTGVLNRRALFDLAHREWARARRSGNDMAVLMLDIDHFKVINDTYGHQVGDEALRYLAHKCQTQLRENDIFARYGGEEFIVVLPDTEKDVALDVATRLLHSIESDKVPAGPPEGITLHVSVGVAMMTADTPSLDELFRLADTQLYRAKNEGRNRVCAA